MDFNIFQFSCNVLVCDVYLFKLVSRRKLVLVINIETSITQLKQSSVTTLCFLLPSSVLF